MGSFEETSKAWSAIVLKNKLAWEVAKQLLKFGVPMRDKRFVP